jgi:type IV secretory pathway TrbD component
MFDEQAPDQISMRSSLYKAENLLGMEPFLAVIFAAVAGIMVLALAKQLSIVIGILIVAIGLPWLKRMGKRDIQMSSVMIRATMLQSYYAPTSYINVKRPKFRKQQRIKRSL